MNWATPSYAWLFGLVGAAAFLVVRAFRQRSRLVTQLGALVPPAATRARAWQAVLAPQALALLVLAALGPRIGFEWVQRKVEGVAIAVVLDVSKSMDAQDVSPSRLERARRELADLVGVMKGDAVGLVLVANGAFVRMPLTIDYGTFLWGLEDTTTATITAQGTSMAGGLEAAVKLLGGAAGNGRAILVVSDGEFHDPSSALDAAVATAREAEIPIYALGIGESAGAPIPLAEGGFKKDSAGNMVLSKLDEDKLRALASGTGGAYVRAVVSDDDVRGLYEGQIRARLEAAERGVRREKVWFERFQWPLAAALVTMIAHALFGIGTRPRVARGVAKAAVLALVLLPLASAQASPREEGLAAHAQKDWAAAIDKLGQARVDNPADAAVGRALAESLYRAGRYRESEQVYDSLAMADVEQKATYLYNAGSAAYRGGRLDDAAQRFEAAAEADPRLEAASKNAAVVRREIALREQPPQQEPEPQPEGGEGEENEESQEGTPSQPSGEGEGEPNQGKGGEGQEQPPEEQGEPGAEGEPQGEGFTPGEEQGGAEQGSEAEEGAVVSDPKAEGEMSEAEAARLVDSVKDGRPHVQLTGRDTEKDW